MLRAEVLETMLCGCVTWSLRACHYDTLRRAHHSFVTRCIGWRNNNRTNHPISCIDTLDGKWEHRGDYAQEADPVRGICGAYGEHETAEVRDVRGTDGGRGLRGRGGKIVDGVSPGRSQSFRYQCRSVDDCSPGRGRMAQDGGTRGGTFVAKLIFAEKVRTGLRDAEICLNVTGRTKDRIAQSKRVRAGSLAIID